MNIPNEQSLLHERLLRPLWLTVCACMLSVFGVYLWTPNIAPIAPAKASLLFEQESWKEPESAQSSDAFITKPLFLIGRRPPSIEGPAATEAAPVEIPVASVARIEGVTLLGIFSSAGVSGVILAETGVGRRRLVEGDSVQDWVLTGVESRAAIFSNGATSARLEMALLSEFRKPEKGERGSRVDDGDDLAGSPVEKPRSLPTFENIRQAKIRSADSELQAIEPAAEPK